MLSYSATSPTLSDKVNYPSFIRIVPSDAYQGSAMARLCVGMGWKRVALVFTTDSYSSKLAEVFVATASTLDMKILATTSFNPGVTDIASQVAIIKSSGATIIVLPMLAADVETVMGVAKTLGMVGPPYVYVGCDGWSSFSTTALPLIEGSIQTNPFVPPNAPRFAADWAAMYATNPMLLANVSVPTSSSVRAFDAVSIIAQGLDRVIRLKALCNYTTPRGMPPRPPSITAVSPLSMANMSLAQQCVLLKQVGEDTMLRYAILSYPYDGVMNRIVFDANGDRLGDFIIQNWLGGEAKTVGQVSMFGDVNVTSSIVWPGKRTTTPKDRLTQSYLLQTIRSSYTIGLSVLAALGIAFAVALLACNIIFSDRPVIQMSSHRINHLIVLGCLASYIGMMILGLDSSRLVAKEKDFSSWCAVKTWIICLSFSVVFGALFSKTYRVYAIFRATDLKVVKVTDWDLLKVISLVVSADLLLLLIWAGSDGFSRSLTNLENSATIDPNDITVRIVPFIEACSSPHFSWFLLAEIVFKAFLLLVGMWLAYQTRDVDIPVLNDSRYIGFAVYNVSFVCIIVFPVTLAVPDDPELQYLISAIGIFVCTTITLCFIFVPKLMAIFHGTADMWTKSSGTVGNTRQVRPASNYEMPRSSVHRISHLSDHGGAAVAYATTSSPTTDNDRTVMITRVAVAH
eukprot:TRINITY_DN5471_c0_g1_i9.p1 TRINITY_DN5471_c0_g1~~TRINITY_DN5471_c0_g1_i9.p1  ORF type:complete len:684 (+),score=100.02 TRINITY_DN5471_c0_g1_i9:321-2372(+)